jgi:ectoine hydroxylase-related dioxygenase (phytanoyl-CoA dioxygenase family)
MMRPTVFDSAPPRKDWQTTGEWIHWDQNPWLEPDFARIQGVLALSDHTDTSGGFHCVPGFGAAHWQVWADANKEYRTDGDLIAVPHGDSMRPHLQRLPMRPGSVCLWDSRTPHGNFPNESGHWRVCQYIGFHPAPHPVRASACLRSN